MRKSTATLGIAAALAMMSFAGTAGATNYSLWIHGRNSGGTPSGFSYWVNGSGTNIAQSSGVNPRAVDYDGTARIATSNPTVVAALNTYCMASAGNSCYIQCHSAGCAQIGYAEAYYPGRWSIIWVLTGGSAAGGSELAGNVAYFFTGHNIDLDLNVSTMRGMYNHDILGDDITGWVYNYMGADWATLTTCLFPGGCVGGSGQNDSAVAFHSSGHYRNSGTDGTSGSGASNANNNTGGAGKGNANYWDWSEVLWVDNSEGSGHCVAGSYPCEEGTAGGVMGVVAGTATGYDK